MVENMKMSIFGKITKKQILIILTIFLLLILIRYFNNLLIYSINYSHKSYFLKNNKKYLEKDYIFVEGGFIFWGLSKKENEKTCIMSSEKILVVHFYDLLCPNKYYIWNYSNGKLKFQTAWFTINLKKGLTKINIYANGKGKIIYSDKSVVDIKSSIKDHYSSLISDIGDIEMDFVKNSNETIKNELINKLRNYECFERSKFLSLYFYSTVIILMFFSIKGFRIQLACLFYAFMLILFGEIFVLGGILFHINFLHNAPQPIFVKGFIVIIFIFCAKKIFEGIKKIKLLNFYDICIILFFILLPWVLYY